jgi:drug/metabolite transporter (DMT)-like permease
MLGLACRLGAMAALAIMFALIKLAGDHGVHIVESMFWRQLAGLPVVFLLLWWTGDFAAIRTQRPMEHAWRMLIGITGMALNFSAMLMLPMAEATTIGFATPVFATVLAAFLLREPTGRYRWGAVVLGFIGVLIAVQPGNVAIKPLGAALALAGAILTAGVSIQMRRMARTESSAAIVFWFSLTSLVPLGLLLPFVGHAHDSQGWLLLAGLSLCGAIGQLLLTTSLRHAPVAAVMTMDYTALIWSGLLGWAVFADLPSESVWLGAPLIMAAGIVIAWREHHLSQKAIKSAAEYPAG